VDDRKPRRVYIDINHWYALGRADVGAPDTPEDAIVLSKLQEEVEAGRLVIPLSSVTYTELTENPRDHQRKPTADVMLKLSRLATIAPPRKVVDEGAPVPAVHRSEIPLEFRECRLPLAQRCAARSRRDRVVSAGGGSVGDAGHGEGALECAPRGALAAAGCCGHVAGPSHLAAGELDRLSSGEAIGLEPGCSDIGWRAQGSGTAPSQVSWGPCRP
jgi:hypothetical protein